MKLMETPMKQEEEEEVVVAGNNVVVVVPDFVAVAEIGVGVAVVAVGRIV